MEIYTLGTAENGYLQGYREEVIDNFESLIWTERFNEVGDFELHIKSTTAIKQILYPGMWLTLNESYRMMQIQSSEDTVDADNQQILICKGTSMEDILNQRVASMYTPGRNDDPDFGFNLSGQVNWTLYGKPADIIRQMFREVALEGCHDVGDIYEFIGTDDYLYDFPNIEEPPATIMFQTEPDTLFNAIKKVADAYWLGFRIVRDPATSLINWNVYPGSDRTSKQNDLPPVIFSQSLDNLQNTSELIDISNTKNVGYTIVGPNSTGGLYGILWPSKAYGPGVLPTVKGLDRRVALDYVQINEDETLAPAVQAQANGPILLGQYQSVYAFDGELNQSTSPLKYGQDYNLGDRVEVRSASGGTNTMIVTEQIFVSDDTGDRSYPTVTLQTYDIPGSWSTYNPAVEWDDLSTGPVWDNQP